MAWVTKGAVPESTPAAEIASHPGRLDACQVNGEVPPVSASVWLYALSEVVCGSVVVVTEGTGLIVSANAFGVAAPKLSVTFSVKLTGPAAGGVPLSNPAALTVSHAGRVVPLSAMVSAPVPPLAAMFCEYGRPTVHAGRGDAVVMVGSGFTVTLKDLVMATLTVSRAVTSNGNGVGVETAGAVPLKPPAEASVSQLGRFELVNVMVPMPPVADKGVA